MTSRRSRAALAGLVWPGLGHVLTGRPLDGLAMMAQVALVLVALAAAPSRWQTAASTAGESVLSLALAVAVGVIALMGLWGLAVRRAVPVRDAGRSSPWARAVARLGRDRDARLGSLLVATLVLAAALAPLLAPHDPIAVSVAAPNTPPGSAAWLGTDAAGRDVLARLLYGARISLPLGLLAVAIAASVGTTVGALAGYCGGWVDRACLGLTDLLTAVPRLVLLLAAVALFGRMEEGRFALIAVVLGLTGWMTVARVVRAETLSLRGGDHMLAARALGLSTPRILTRHLLPLVGTPVIVHATLMVGSTILLEAALSFLGLGVAPPTATWGNMVGGGMNHLHHWWLSLFPGLAITAAVLGFNLLGEGIRAALAGDD